MVVALTVVVVGDDVVDVVTGTVVEDAGAVDPVDGSLVVVSLATAASSPPDKVPITPIRNANTPTATIPGPSHRFILCTSPDLRSTLSAVAPTRACREAFVQASVSTE